MPEVFDLLILGAAVYDGSGAPGVVADVGVRGDTIARIGMLADCDAPQVVEAQGFALLPGFIDVHAHDDVLVLTNPDLPSKVRQGITTTIVGNCGFGAAPFEAMRRGGLIAQLASDTEPWDGFAGYFERLERQPPALNVAALVGHGTVRLAGMGGIEDRTATPDELAAMERVLREGLEAGAVGMSSGLVYEPGRYAPTEELVRLARLVAAREGVYASHIRNEGYHLLDAVGEAIAIGEQAGCRVQISHLKASGRESWGHVGAALELIEQARARGVGVRADQYPYTAGSTSLYAVVQNGGLPARSMPARGGEGLGSQRADDIMVATAPGRPEFEGKTFTALAAEMDLPLEDAVQRVLDDCSPGAFVVMFSMSEDDVRTVIVHPDVMVGTDALDFGGKPHPRAYGTYPRILQHYVREEGVLSLEGAVHKMTGMPAEQFGIADRGFIREGLAADLVIIDPATVADRATYQDPTVSPLHIPWVWVNGEPVVAEGAPTGRRPGRPLRRG